MKTIYTLLRDRLEGIDDRSFLRMNEITKDLAEFQKVAVKQLIVDETVNRYLEQKHTVSLTTAQKYLLKELQALYNEAKDEDLKAQIEAFQTVFQRMNRIAIHSELNKIKNNKMTGMPLIKELSEIFSRHNLFEGLHSPTQVDEKPPVPKVICSELLD